MKHDRVFKKFNSGFQGIKCVYELCRVCCRDKCYSEEAECTGHGFLLEKKRRKQMNQSNTKTMEVSLENGATNNNDS